MRAMLLRGHTYRAKVNLGALLKLTVPRDVLTQELANYHLFGTVTDTDVGYIVEAEFRGRSAAYELPDFVQDIEFIR